MEEEMKANSSGRSYSDSHRIGRIKGVDIEGVERRKNHFSMRLARVRFGCCFPMMHDGSSFSLGHGS